MVSGGRKITVVKMTMTSFYVVSGFVEIVVLFSRRLATSNTHRS